MTHEYFPHYRGATTDILLVERERDGKPSLFYLVWGDHACSSIAFIDPQDAYSYLLLIEAHELLRRADSKSTHWVFSEIRSFGATAKSCIPFVARESVDLETSKLRDAPDIVRRVLTRSHDKVRQEVDACDDQTLPLAGTDDFEVIPQARNDRFIRSEKMHSRPSEKTPVLSSEDTNAAPLKNGRP